MGLAGRERRNVMDAVFSDAALERVKTRSAPRMARLAAIFARLQVRLESHRSHRTLMELSDTQLRDIGLSRADVAGPDWEIDHLRFVPDR
jgi:uncharacterized protein YjiS (DUF1127 family)